MLTLGCGSLRSASCAGRLGRPADGRLWWRGSGGGGGRLCAVPFAGGPLTPSGRGGERLSSCQSARGGPIGASRLRRRNPAALLLPLELRGRRLPASLVPPRPCWRPVQTKQMRHSERHLGCASFMWVPSSGKDDGACKGLLWRGAEAGNDQQAFVVWSSPGRAPVSAVWRAAAPPPRRAVPKRWGTPRPAETRTGWSPSRPVEHRKACF